MLRPSGSGSGRWGTDRRRRKNPQRAPAPCNATLSSSGAVPDRTGRTSRSRATPDEGAGETGARAGGSRRHQGSSWSGGPVLPRSNLRHATAGTMREKAAKKVRLFRHVCVQSAGSPAGSCAEGRAGRAAPRGAAAGGASRRLRWGAAAERRVASSPLPATVRRAETKRSLQSGPTPLQTARRPDDRDIALSPAAAPAAGGAPPRRVWVAMIGALSAISTGT